MVYWVRYGLCISPSPPQLCSFLLSGFPPWLLIVRHCLYFYSDIPFFLGDGYSSLDEKLCNFYSFMHLIKLIVLILIDSPRNG